MANGGLAALLVLFFNLAINGLACPTCPYPTPPSHTPKLPPKLPPKHPPKVKRPHPPKGHSPLPPFPPKPPVVQPPVVLPPPPYVPRPPVVLPPPYVPKPPVVKPPPTETPCPPPPPPPFTYPPPVPETCPVDALKLEGCADVLGGLVHIGVGSSAKEACCPVLQGLADLDAALCLCTTIKLKLLNINVVLPIALQVLLDCGKYPPSGFKCPT